MLKHLPKLPEGSCHFISRSTWDYNCVGLVVGDFRWWHWIDQDEHYWPDGVKRDRWAKNYIEALATEHFEKCEGPDPEIGYEKAAVFHQGGLFKHIAKVSSGVWHSKIGEYEDFEHPGGAMEGGSYGDVFTYLKREIRYGGHTIPLDYLL